MFELEALFNLARFSDYLCCSWTVFSTNENDSFISCPGAVVESVKQERVSLDPGAIDQRDAVICGLVASTDDEVTILELVDAVVEPLVWQVRKLTCL